MPNDNEQLTAGGEPVVDDRSLVKSLNGAAQAFLARELDGEQPSITDQVRTVADAVMEKVAVEFSENEPEPAPAKPEQPPAEEAAAEPKRGPDGRFQKTDTAPAAAPAAERKFTVNWKGRPVEMSETDTLRFAAMGFDYQQARAALAEETKNVRGYGEYMRFLDENPQVAAVITDVVNTFKSTGIVPRLSLDNGADQMAIPPGVGELQARQQSVETWIRQQEAAREADRRWRLFESMIEQDPEVKALRAASRTADADPFMEKLVEATTRDPNADPQVVFRMVATDALRWSRALAPRPDQKPRPSPAARLMTMPDGRATGRPPAAPPEYSPDDLGTTTRSRAAALLKQMGL